MNGAWNMASKKRAKNITEAIAQAMDDEQWDHYKRSEDGRKQARMKDRNHDLYNGYAEQEYTRKVPKGYHRMPNGKLMKGSRHK